MLLRSLSKHVKDQNWFAVALDFLIVVVGILIAFQITNWNEARVDREREHDFIVRLHEDFSASIEGIDKEIVEVKEQIEDQESILTALRTCELSPNNRASFERGVVRLGWINQPTFIRRTIDELIANGEMGIIRNKDLRKTLADITNQAEWRSSVTDAVQRTTERFRYVLDEQVLYGPPGADDVLSFASVSYDLQTLCKNPKIASAVSKVSLSGRERVSAYEGLLEEYQNVLSDLESELGSNWKANKKLEDK